MTHSHTKLVPPVYALLIFGCRAREHGSTARQQVVVHRHAGRRGLAGGIRRPLQRPEHMFLPEFVRGTADKADLDGPQPSESLLAMCGRPDVNTTGGLHEPRSHGPLVGTAQATGPDRADFIGYWEDNCPVKTTTPKGLVFAVQDSRTAASSSR